MLAHHTHTAHPSILTCRPRATKGTAVLRSSTGLVEADTVNATGSAGTGERDFRLGARISL